MDVGEKAVVEGVDGRSRIEELTERDGSKMRVSKTTALETEEMARELSCALD